MTMQLPWTCSTCGAVNYHYGACRCQAPVSTLPYASPVPHGCICPPGAEATCRGLACPRNPPMTQKYENGNLVWSR